MRLIQKYSSKLHLNAQGDTIVEVMIVLAILSFAFSLAMATATKATSVSRNSEEHSRALGTEASQIELLRAAVAKKADLPSSKPFCMKADGTPIDAFPGGYHISSDAQTEGDGGFTNYPSECTDGLYFTSIEGDGSGNYTVRVRWLGNSGTLKTQQELMTYRTRTLPSDTTYDVQLGSSPASVKVTVQAIPLKPGDKTVNRTPSCSSPGRVAKGGTSIKLDDLSSGASFTDVTSSANSSVIFSDITEYHNYHESVTGVPSDYNICPGTATTATGTTKTAQPGQTTTFNDLVIYPVCTPYTTRDNYGYYSDYLGYYGDYLGYYSDYYGYYGDPYTVYWWGHDGVDQRHLEWNWPYSPYSTMPSDFVVSEGGVPVNYRRDGTGYNSSGPFYERWVLHSGTAYTAPYNHYSAPYNHYTAPYNHYTNPYNHYSAYYTAYKCPG